MILPLMFATLGALTPEARLTAIQAFLHVDNAHDLQELWSGSGNSIWGVSVGPCCHDRIVAFSADTPVSQLAIVDGDGALQEITIVGSNKGPTVLLQTSATDGDYTDNVLATLWLPTMMLREIVRYYGSVGAAKRNGDRVDLALALSESAASWGVTAAVPFGKWCTVQMLERFSDKGKADSLKMMITLGAGGSATITTCK